MIECQCKQIINGEHVCPQEGKSLRITECAFNPWKDNYECDVCCKDAEKKEYDDQWSDDEDGYTRCSHCREKCDYGEQCTWCMEERGGDEE